MASRLNLQVRNVRNVRNALKPAFGKPCLLCLHCSLNIVHCTILVFSEKPFGTGAQLKLTLICKLDRSTSWSVNIKRGEIYGVSVLKRFVVGPFKTVRLDPTQATDGYRTQIPSGQRKRCPVLKQPTTRQLQAASDVKKAQGLSSTLERSSLRIKRTTWKKRESSRSTRFKNLNSGSAN